MSKIQQANLAVILSYKGSLQYWKEAGILDRELQLYKKLAPYFRKIYILSFASDSEREQILLGDVGVVLVNKFNLPAWLYALTAWFLHRKVLKDVQVIKTNQLSAVLLALWIKVFHPAKKLITRAGFQWSQFQKHNNLIKKAIVAIVEFLAYQLSNHIIVASLADRDYIGRRYFIAVRNITVISNLIDTELFKPTNSVITTRPICSVGRLEPQKNFDLLIRALKGTNKKLVLYGAGSKDIELRELAKNEGVEVEFRGRVSNNDLAKGISESGMFVLPSAYEGNPKALLEAMASGLPVIASDIAAHRAIITNGENGLIVPSEVVALQEAIKKVAADSNLAKEIGNKARKYIMTHASAEAVVAAEVSVYERVL